MCRSESKRGGKDRAGPGRARVCVCGGKCVRKWKACVHEMKKGGKGGHKRMCGGRGGGGEGDIVGSSHHATAYVTAPPSAR